MPNPRDTPASSRETDYSRWPALPPAAQTAGFTPKTSNPLNGTNPAFVSLLAAHYPSLDEVQGRNYTCATPSDSGLKARPGTSTPDAAFPTHNQFTRNQPKCISTPMSR